MQSTELDDLMSMLPSPQQARQCAAYVTDHLSDFKATMAAIPISPGPGSISTAEAFWLYRLTRELAPRIIVDSGTATGWSAFILAHAAPAATILCFDPYAEPQALPPSAVFHRGDWTRHAPRTPPPDLALFDDHVNHRLRLRQAQARGVRNVVLHDVYPTLSKSLVSIRFQDLLGLVSRMHTFEPLWAADDIFRDTSSNPQLFRWLTWLSVEPGSRLGLKGVALRARQRMAARNPGAAPESRLNWRARSE
jgi:hypothetical protein